MTGATTTSPTAALVDAFDVRRVRSDGGLLDSFNEALVLTAADVHIARRLGAIAGETDEQVLLAAALAARAPRVGHVCIDLATAASTVHSESEDPIDVGALPWPETEQWMLAVQDTDLVVVGDDGGRRAPLRLEGTLLYLDRYWRHERAVAEAITARNAARPDVDVDVLAAGLDRLFDGDPPDLQRLAAAVAVLRGCSVVAGGPGTGKTTTVAKILALLDEQAIAAGNRPPRIAMTAPTGKAAARLEESVHEVAVEIDIGDEVRARLVTSSASTIHRLLGWRPDNRSRFRHDRHDPLPADVVVVDESSMVSVTLMAQLLDAVRPDARIILVGDPNQLSSVEAGAVLGDVVGPATHTLQMSPGATALAEAATGQAVPAAVAAPGFGDGIVVLRRVHRFAGAIAELAEAIRLGDADSAVEVLSAGHDDVTWLRPDDNLAPVRSALVEAGRAVVDAAATGDGTAALRSLGSVRILCAHRRGPHGVSAWLERAERWLGDAIPGYGNGGRWYLGRPLLVTHNDYGLQLFNGDVGVIVAGPDGQAVAAFERRGEIVRIGPARLSSIETVHAMTIHKSQGSQFDTVAVVLPDADSRLLTRELLYTAVTRARAHVVVVTDELTLRSAVGHPIARSSGLRRRLWS